MHTQGGIIGVQVLWPTGETYRGGEYHNKWYRIHLGLEAEFDSCVRPEDLDAEDLEFGEKVTRHGIRE
ncbi:MAG: hypothetical protein U9M98_03275 [Patescibacteria group bacterium]|nr:hypothetical protein [Patescibacteria group bacterium]